MCVGNPTVNSYCRMWDTGFWAPIYKNWGWQNRTTTVRVASGGRFEYRGVDSSCNPYLTVATLLRAGLDGVRRELDPGPPQQGNTYDLLAEGAEIEKVPDSPRQGAGGARGRRGRALSDCPAASTRSSTTTSATSGSATWPPSPTGSATSTWRYFPSHVRNRRNHLQERQRRAPDRPRHDLDAAVDEAPGPGLDRLRAVSRSRPASTSSAINLAESTAPRDLEFADDVRRRRRDVLTRITAAGAVVKDTDDINEYTFSATVDYHGELKQLADHIESVPHTEVLSLGHSLEIVKDLGDAADGRRPVRPRRLLRLARDRPRADGDRVRRRHRQRPSVLGLPVLRRRGRAQRAADQLPPVAPSAGVPRPPVRVDVRLGDHRRLPRRPDGRRRVARGRDAPLARGPRRRVHLHLRVRGRARDGQGRARRQADGPVRGRGHGRAGLRGDGDPRGDRPRDRDVRPLREHGDGMDRDDDDRREPLFDPRGLVELDARRPEGLRDRRFQRALRRPRADDAADQPGAALAALRAGRDRRDDRQPGRQALARRPAS